MIVLTDVDAGAAPANPAAGSARSGAVAPLGCVGVLVILDLNVSRVAVALVVGLALIAWIPMPVLAALALLFTWLGERRRERWALAPRCPGPQTQSSRGASLESELRSCRAGVLRAVVLNVGLATVVQSRRSYSAQLLGISLGLVVRTRPLWAGRGKRGEANCLVSNEPAHRAPHAKGCPYTVVGMCVTWHL
jgi:hypothetical protein